MGVHWTGIVFGLGFVMSFGYWTTDFLVVQRVLSANNLRAAKMAPIIGAAFKMAVPLIVILPGLLALAVLKNPDGSDASTWWARTWSQAPRTATTKCCR
jgi:SSS family solute:Na+ symporter